MVYYESRREHAPHGPSRQNHTDEGGCHNGILDRTLSAVPYNPLIPLAMASQSSCNLGRNKVMAIMAMTTSTPTKMAYSVVPCPLASASFARAETKAPVVGGGAAGGGWGGAGGGGGFLWGPRP